MDDASDSNLLAAFRAGDREAFAVLVARHQGLVRTACLRQAPSADAEDCIQAVFLVLSRRPGAAAGAPALAAWLLRVAYHVCSRAQRAARRRKCSESAAAQAMTQTAGQRPEAFDHLDDCLARLPERQRVAVSLQYLAEQPVESVAEALGVSRDNAYQLVSRGLAGLRSLLAQRGIALSAPALLILLASEGQAATATAGAAATASIAATISATPSAGAASLATGTCTAMTLTAPATITTVAASLLLTVGVTAAVITAEPAPSLAPTTRPGPVPQLPVPATTGGEQALDRLVSVDFQDQPLIDVVKYMREIGANVVLDPRVLGTTPASAPAPITLRIERMKLRQVLGFVEKLTGTTHAIRDGTYVILPTAAVPANTPAEPRDKPAEQVQGPPGGAMPNAWDKALDQEITVDFSDTLLEDAIGFLQRASHQNFIIAPQLAATPHPVNLHVEKMHLRNVLTHLEMITGANHEIRDEAYVLAVDTAARPPSVEGLDLAGAEAHISAKLALPVTFDFQNEPLPNVIFWIRQSVGVNCVLTPAMAASRSTVTLKVNKMPLQDALRWLCMTNSMSVRYVAQALVFDLAGSNRR